ncbi:MAG: S-adenosylmethionine:tRNA ribosyltransferase-isomerase, partial [Gammaproteobacteria bacterium]
MYRSAFHYHLPPERIAIYPAAERGASRLLCLDAATGAISDGRFADIVDLLRPEDLLVFNDTRVMKARLYGHKDSGGAVEVLLERVLSKRRATAKIRASKPPRGGTR